MRLKTENRKEIFRKLINDHIDSNKKEWGSNNRFDWIVGDLIDSGEIHDAKEINKINESIDLNFLSQVAKNIWIMNI